MFGYTVTNQLRIKRVLNFAQGEGEGEMIEVLQQLWLDDAGNGMWEDVPIIEAADDFYYGG